MRKRRCQIITKKGKRCRILLKIHEEKFCHAHDPLGTYQMNLQFRREAGPREEKHHEKLVFPKLT